MAELTDKQLLDELQKKLEARSICADEIEKLSAQLLLLNKKLEQAEAFKTNFLSNVRNEIYNPFFSVLGLSKNIMAVKANETDKIRNMARMLHTEALTLSFQLMNIFAAAEIEAGEAPLQIAKVDVPELVESVMESVNELAVSKNVSLRLSPIGANKQPYQIYTDSDKLLIVLTNLLRIAIELSKTDTGIRITLSPEHDQICVYTPGPHDQQVNSQLMRLYDDFTQIHFKRNGSPTGYPLELSVTGALINLLQGGLDIGHNDKHDCVFTVKLPPIKPEINQGDISSNGISLFFEGDADERF